MMQQIQLRIKTEDAQLLHSNWGYTLYGILAQYADSDYIAALHQGHRTPISQYLEVLPDKKEAIWHIHLLGVEAIYEIGKVLQNNDRFTAQHHHTSILVLDKQWGEQISEQAFCQQYLVEKEAQRRLQLEFLTPTGFKSEGVYQLFPSIELIIKSLWRDWGLYAQEVLLDGDDVREQLIRHTQIREYRLRSAYYPVKGNRITAFKGQIGITCHGPEPLVRLVNLLLAFGQYSGLGMKTSLGMGGYRLF